MYNNNSKELCFNGMLSKQNTSEKELYKRLIKTLKYREEYLKKIIYDQKNFLL